MTRWKAAGSHLALSILVIGGIAVTAFLLWYPHGIYKVSGLDHILLVMLGIDLTAGPLLTCVVFNTKKPELKRDLAVIVFLQLAFLAYGLHTLWGGRPVFLVGTPETFTVVFASEVSEDDLAEAPRPEWRRLSWTGPQLVATRMPDEPEQRRAILEEFMAGGAGIERSPKYYMPFQQVAPDILRSASPVGDDGAVGADDVRASNRPASALRWLPVVSRRGEGVMLLDANNGEPVHAVSSAASDTRPPRPARDPSRN